MEFELTPFKKLIKIVCLTFIYLANELKGLSLGLGYKCEFGLDCNVIFFLVGMEFELKALL